MNINTRVTASNNSTVKQEKNVCKDGKVCDISKLFVNDKKYNQPCTDPDGSPPLTLGSGSPSPSITVPDLGQKFWARVPKSQQSKLDVRTFQNKCKDLELYISQQAQLTGFIPLSPLQFPHIRNCTQCQVEKQWLHKPIELYRYVKFFNCPNFMGARVQVNFDMNVDLIDKLAASYWDWLLPLFLRFGFPMDFRGWLRPIGIGCCHFS